MGEGGEEKEGEEVSKDGVYVCVELGVNWGGDFDLIKRLITDAAVSKADAVKLQYFDEAFIESSGYPDWLKERLRSMILSSTDIWVFINHAHERGIEVVVTPFSAALAEDLKFLKDLDGIKIRAKDWLDRKIWDAAVSLGKPLYYSVPYCNGEMLTSGPIGRPIMPEEAEWAGSRRGRNVYRVYCVPRYPPMPSELYLTLVSQHDGFSSHYPDWSVPFAAAVIAVNEEVKHNIKRRFYLEVHVRPGSVMADINSYTIEELRMLYPDWDSSLSPMKVRRLCESVALLEEAIG